jgi:hypothetical protein
VDPGVPIQRVRALAWAVLACALLLARPVAAHAGWPLAAQGRVMLGFGAVYSAGEGDSSRHRGTDIEAAEGDRVLAPLAGTVTFAGSVPGVGGGRVTAVTLETSRGKITLLPLEHASVSRGAQVSEGAAVGTLAGSGDGSSSGAHLHVGAREGDLYVDPLGLMAPPAAPTPTTDSGAATTAHSAATAPAAAASGVALSSGVSLAPAARAVAGAKPSRVAKPAASGAMAPGVSIAARAAIPAGVTGASAAAGVVGAGGLSAAAANKPQSTVLTRDGVVVAVGSQPVTRNVAQPVWAGIAARVQTLAVRSIRIASLALLGAMAALGALWPLWRGRGEKGSGKVLVSGVVEDVAAAPSR